ncbi:hypothetical protein BGZ98_008274 [Dissophora globulifera]|nr:hypothetical protein BGZ98_008274 [Dissophora globulifera]
MGMSNPLGQAGPWSKNPDKLVHSWIGFQGKPFPCGGYTDGPVTNLTIGEVINVRFWTFGLKNITATPPLPKTIPTARHGGGSCEFSLSYDGMKTWKVIGQYTKSCPDIYTEWPVLIPDNIPECTNPKTCFFSMSWIAHKVPQFYHHCANVVVKGGSNYTALPSFALPTLDMTVVDLPPNKTLVSAVGDNELQSPGPDENEIKMNMNGDFKHGGKLMDKGLSLNLVYRQG